MSRLLIVGGGITGLAAAWEATQHQRVEVIVLDADDRAGGKIRTSPISGAESTEKNAGELRDDAVSDAAVGEMVIDEGADAFLARVPDAVGLCRELGLEDELTEPAIGRAKVFVDGQLHFLPGETVLGVPVEFGPLEASGLLSADGLALARAEVDGDWAAPSDDVTIGAFLTERYGRELVDHVVGPLIGGINAGDVDRLSLRAVTPQLADAAAEGGSLTAALRRRVAPTAAAGPVFHALRGGTERLVEALVDALLARGVTIETGTRALACAASLGAAFVDVERRRASGDTETATLTTDELLICTPAHATADLVRDVSPEAADELSQIVYSSVALVTFVYDGESVTTELDASGFLIPRDAGLLMTAASVGSSKWTHWDNGRHVVLRVSAGHVGDDRGVALSDRDLVDGLRADLERTMGIVDAPVAARISRWPAGFAQYESGHLDRVARIERALARDCPQVMVAGAAYRGLGIPACIRQGRAVARELVG